MTNHPNRQKIGILKSSIARTKPSYAMLERLRDGSLCTYMMHEDVGGETRVACHGNDYAAALRRYDALEIAAANRG